MLKTVPLRCHASPGTRFNCFYTEVLRRMPMLPVKDEDDLNTIGSAYILHNYTSAASPMMRQYTKRNLHTSSRVPLCHAYLEACCSLFETIGCSHSKLSFFYWTAFRPCRRLCSQKIVLCLDIRLYFVTFSRYLDLAAISDQHNIVQSDFVLCRLGIYTSSIAVRARNISVTEPSTQSSVSAERNHCAKLCQRLRSTTKVA